MKLKTEYIKYIIITVPVIIFTEALIFSQDIYSGEVKRPELYIGINFGPSKNRIINEGIFSLAGLSSNNRNTVSGSFELGFFFSKSIGLSTGLGYESYSTELSLSSYSNKFDAIDSDNETYERRVSGSDIKELQKISFLNVPFCISFQISSGSRSGFFIHTGINLSIPFSNEYNSSGTFTFAGYYPAYNVILQNLPEYGFQSESKILSNGKLDLKSNIIDGVASAGFQLFISEKIQIALGVDYKRSLSNISKYNSPDKFVISSDINQINSMMGGTSKSLAESIGFKFSFRYYIMK
jgi:hypothetical protein